MRAVIQAVSSASVRVNGGEPRAIGPGLVILLGVKDTDTPVAEQVQKLFVLDKNNMASPESAESE